MSSSSPGWDKIEPPNLVIMQSDGVVNTCTHLIFKDLLYMYEYFACVLVRVL